MKLWYYVPPGTGETVDATSTRAALGIYMAIWTSVIVLVIALVAFGVWAFTGRELTIHESVLDFISYWLIFVATFNGLTIGAGWIKQRESPKVAEAEATRAATKAGSNGTAVPAVLVPVATVPVTVNPPKTVSANAVPLADLSLLASREPSKFDDESSDG